MIGEIESCDIGIYPGGIAFCLGATTMDRTLKTNGLKESDEETLKIIQDRQEMSLVSAKNKHNDINTCPEDNVFCLVNRGTNGTPETEQLEENVEEALKTNEDRQEKPLVSAVNTHSE